MRTPAGGPPWWRGRGNSLIIKPEPIELGADVGQPSFVGTRQTHSRIVGTVNVRFQPGRAEDRAGLGVLQDTSHWFALVVARAAAGSREVRLLRRSSSSQADSGTVIARAPLVGYPAMPVRLQVKADGAAIFFSYAVGLKGWRLFPAPTDAPFQSTRVARGFTGVMIGPVTIADPGRGVAIAASLERQGRRAEAGERQLSRSYGPH